MTAAGLDSYLASSVVEGLQNLTKSARSILCTIHQPSKSVFERFDKLLLLSAGYPLYFGPIKQCKAHFEGLGFITSMSSSANGNPAEFVISVAADLSGNVQSLQNISSAALSKLSDTEKAVLSQSTLTDSGTTAQDSNIFVREAREVLTSGPIIVILLKRELLAMSRRNFFIAVSLRTALSAIFIGNLLVVSICLR